MPVTKSLPDSRIKRVAYREVLKTIHSGWLKVQFFKIFVSEKDFPFNEQIIQTLPGITAKDSNKKYLTF
jgi:hypothetical protein